MESEFNIEVALLNHRAQVTKSPYYLTVIREIRSSVLVDQIPLTEYFVQINGQNREDRITIKLYRANSDGKWYDRSYSEEAELNSPEFGIPSLNTEVKRAIDAYESHSLVTTA